MTQGCYLLSGRVGRLVACGFGWLRYTWKNSACRIARICCYQII